jgi:hypothetical protein
MGAAASQARTGFQHFRGLETKTGCLRGMQAAPMRLRQFIRHYIASWEDHLAFDIVNLSP